MMKRLVFTIMVTVLTIASWSFPAQPASAIPTHRALERTLTAQVRSPANACASGTKGMLSTVAVSSAADVWATGFDHDNRALIEHWDGICWQVVPSASLTGQIAGIAAISPHDVWAVGTAATASRGGGALIAHWDGVRWKTVPSPSTESRGLLSGVAAVSARDVWAVGWAMNETDAAPHGLIVHWDGMNWRAMPGGVMGLQGVAAISARDAWAVGNTLIGSGTKRKAVTLMEHWDGSRWRVVTSPSLEGDENMLVAVSAASAREVWAAGWVEIKGAGSPLMLHWDGVRWSIAPASGFKSPVTGLAAISDHDVWAVAGVMQHWNGKRWSAIPLAAPATKVLGVGAMRVAAISARDVWAVGAVAVSKNEIRTLVEHWDGVRWHITPS
jgi:hypothetical protein